LEIFQRRHEILSTHEELSDCYGLKCLDEYLYILGSCTVYKYYLQDQVNLQLVRSIDLNPSGIYKPDQIDIDEYGDTLYISDAALGVYILNTSGRVLKHIPVNEARGISYGGQNKVFVCCFDSDNVLEINQEAAKTKSFLSVKHRVNAPCAVFFDRIRRRLYVGMHNNNYILYADILD
jgi:DNA-binding beta-propeller fold protein YncE